MHADTRPQWIYSTAEAGVSLVTAFTFTLLLVNTKTRSSWLHMHSIWLHMQGYGAKTNAHTRLQRHVRWQKHLFRLTMWCALSVWSSHIRASIRTRTHAHTLLCLRPISHRPQTHIQTNTGCPSTLIFQTRMGCLTHMHTRTHNHPPEATLVKHRACSKCSEQP